MATLSEIRQNPETLGSPVTDDDVDLFCRAVETLMANGLDEAEAVEQVWGTGDWVPRAEAIVQSS